MKNIGKISIYLFIAYIITINFLDFNIPLTHTKLESYVDSDMLYFHRLFMDIFFQKHHLFSWYLTPAPYFFPDMLIFFLLEILFFPHVLLIIAVFGGLQYLLMIFLSEKIASILLKENRATLLIYISLLLALALLVIPSQENYRLAIGAAYHFGGFINGLLFILLSVLAISKPKSNKLLIIAALLSFLSSASDLLFIVQYGLPALILALIIRPKLLLKKHCLALLSTMILGILFKYFCLIHVDIFYISFQPQHYFSQLKNIFSHLPQLLFKKHYFLASIILGFYLFLGIQLTVTQYGQNKLPWLILPNKLLFFLGQFILISTVFTLLFFTAFNSAGSIISRYMLNIYFFPLVFCWLPFASILHFNLLRKLQALLICIAIILALFVTGKNFKPLNWEYYPFLSQCIDSQIYEYNHSHIDKIKYGIASNAQAGVITSFSKEGLQLVEMLSNLMPQYWINNPERYRKHYDFAVIATPANNILNLPEHILDKNLIEKINGKPIFEFSCHNEATILIYGKNKLNVPLYEQKTKKHSAIF